MFSLLKSKFTSLVKIVIAFLAPIQPLILIVGLMIALDTVTGLWKAIKLKEAITSRKLSNIAGKMALYGVSIITVFILNKYMLNDIVLLFTSVPLFLVKVVAMIFASIEIVSINENIQQATGLNLFAKFRDMFKRAVSVKKELKSLVKDDEDEPANVG